MLQNTIPNYKVLKVEKAEPKRLPFRYPQYTGTQAELTTADETSSLSLILSLCTRDTVTCTGDTVTCSAYSSHNLVYF
jgi:hypothetical protein